jgi:hypothetical protein
MSGPFADIVRDAQTIVDYRCMLDRAVEFLPAHRRAYVRAGMSEEAGLCVRIRKELVKRRTPLMRARAALKVCIRKMKAADGEDARLAARTRRVVAETHIQRLRATETVAFMPVFLARNPGKEPAHYHSHAVLAAYLAILAVLPPVTVLDKAVIK